MAYVKTLVLLLTITACFQQVALQFRKRHKKGEGDPCKLDNTQKGVCRILNDCPAALKELSESQKWPQTCSQRADGVSIICCDENTQKPIPANNRGKVKATTEEASSSERENKLNGSPKSVVNNDSPGQISREKCDFYSRWLDAPTLVPGSDSKVAGKCANVGQFIIGGKEAEPLEFPHMVHLGFGEDENKLIWDCGGSLISEQYVLTAAHCLQKQDRITNVTYVRLGSSDQHSIQIVKIKEAIPHPKYKRRQFYNDIALLKLEEEIQFDNYKRPACLNVDPEIKVDKGIASGWGITEKGRQSEKLLKVLVPFISNRECRQDYNVDPMRLPNGIDDSIQICAGGSEKDSCQGDSGGPIQILLKKPKCIYSILGVTSFGRGCGKFPGVYSRVSAFVPWIEKVVWRGN